MSAGHIARQWIIGMRSRFIRSLAAVAGLVLFPLSTNADTSFSREDAFEVGPWSQSRIDSEIARLRCVFGDQFDDVLGCLTSDPNPPAGMVTVGTLRTRSGLGGGRPANFVY